MTVTAFGGWTLVRLDGVDGDLGAQLSWRWAATDEERFLAERNATAPKPASAGIVRSTAEWPGFRGSDRGGLVAEPIRTDWPSDGLPELWRIRVGPGWSSFCVVGDRLFTQEQRGEYEAVVCYDATNGAEIWEHKDETRFQEFISGAGPRATPTFADGRLYATGASGTVNCLNPADASVYWTRNLVDDTNAPIPMWGFSSSPLIHEGLAIVYSGAGGGQSLVAYDIQTGNVRWTGGDSVLSYSSPHLATIHDQLQVLMMSEDGLTSFDPASGTRLWQHAWPLGGGSARIIQPHVMGNDVIIGTGYGLGSRRITVSRDDDKWATSELWSTLALKPYFNNFVELDDHAFGFDGAIFTCVDLKTGKRCWKRGRYGSGQVLLAAEQKLLVVLGEKGDLVLLAADPSSHRELHRFKALRGKTWNHPVIAGGRLYVRNGVEAACFEISP